MCWYYYYGQSAGKLEILSLGQNGNVSINEKTAVTVEKDVINEKEVNTEIRVSQNEEERTKSHVYCISLEQPSQGDVFCLFCGEKYEEPPTEDWLQRPLCCEWAHELCTDSENGWFLCINCET